jgi:Putative prokaryotic signal transducing protein
VGDSVRLTVVRDEGEAEVLCGLLRGEGIRCAYRATDITAEYAAGVFGGWREVLVDEDDLSRARELLPNA